MRTDSEPAASPGPRRVDSICHATRISARAWRGRRGMQHALSAAHPGTQTRGIIIGQGTATRMPCAGSLRQTPPPPARARASRAREPCPREVRLLTRIYARPCRGLARPRTLRVFNNQTSHNQIID